MFLLCMVPLPVQCNGIMILGSMQEKSEQNYSWLSGWIWMACKLLLSILRHLLIYSI